PSSPGGAVPGAHAGPPADARGADRHLPPPLGAGVAKEHAISTPGRRADVVPSPRRALPDGLLLAIPAVRSRSHHRRRATPGLSARSGRRGSSPGIRGPALGG